MYDGKEEEGKRKTGWERKTKCKCRRGNSRAIKEEVEEKERNE